MLTDQVDQALKFATSAGLAKDSFRCHEIPSYGWPDATIRRYEMMLNHLDFSEKRIEVYLDADMEFLANPLPDIRKTNRAELMTFIAHPGFYRPLPRRKRLELYSRNLQLIKSDLVLWLRFGGIGTWETRRESQAFVERSKRATYYCGGVWFGQNNCFSSFLRNAQSMYEVDRSLGLMPIWHDESYLNRFASYNLHRRGEPSFCYVDRYPQLRTLRPLIRAVTKSDVHARINE